MAWTEDVTLATGETVMVAVGVWHERDRSYRCAYVVGGVGLQLTDETMAHLDDDELLAVGVAAAREI